MSCSCQEARAPLLVISTDQWVQSLTHFVWCVNLRLRSLKLGMVAVQCVHQWLFFFFCGFLLGKHEMLDSFWWPLIRSHSPHQLYWVSLLVTAYFLRVCKLHAKYCRRNINSPDWMLSAALWCGGDATEKTEEEYLGKHISSSPTRQSCVDATNVILQGVKRIRGIQVRVLVLMMCACFWHHRVVTALPHGPPRVPTSDVVFLVVHFSSKRLSRSRRCAPHTSTKTASKEKTSVPVRI